MTKISLINCSFLSLNEQILLPLRFFIPFPYLLCLLLFARSLGHLLLEFVKIVLQSHLRKNIVYIVDALEISVSSLVMLP